MDRAVLLTSKNKLEVTKLLISYYPTTFLLAVFIAFQSSISLSIESSTSNAVQLMAKASHLFSGIIIAVLFAALIFLRELKTSRRLELISLFGVLVFVCISSLTAVRFHYSNVLYPLLWSIFLFRCVCEQGSRRGEIATLVILFCLITAELFTFFKVLFFSNNIGINVELAGDLVRILPTFPAFIEKHYLGYLSAIGAIISLSRKQPLFYLTALVFIYAAVLSDSRSGLLALILGGAIVLLSDFRTRPVKAVVAVLCFVILCSSLSSISSFITGFKMGKDPIEVQQANNLLECKGEDENRLFAKEEIVNPKECGPNLVGLNVTNEKILKELQNVSGKTDIIQGVQMQVSRDSLQENETLATAPFVSQGRTYDNFFQDTGGRLKIWWAAIVRILDAPFFGEGRFASPSKQAIEGMNSPYSSIGTLYHNSFLQSGVDYGLPALFCWLCLLFLLFIRATIVGKAFIVCTVVHFCFQNEFLIGEYSIFIATFSIILPCLNSCDDQ